MPLLINENGVEESVAERTSPPHPDEPVVNGWIFAGHCASIFTQPADGKPREYCPCPGVRAVVVVTPAPPSLQSADGVWDGVTINGRHCGNRHGAMHQFSNMIVRAGAVLGTDTYGDAFHFVPLQPPKED